MGCVPGVAGKNRSAGVVVVSIILSMRTPRSIMRESATPVMKQTAATPPRIQFVLISKTPTTEQHIGRAPFEPMEQQTSDSIEWPSGDCAALTRNTRETPPTNWQATA